VGTERPIPVEELIEFPTVFSFKAVGPHSEQFIAAAENATRGALGATSQVDRRTRPSRNGTYVSVTLDARIEDVDELHAVYAGLRAIPGVITVL
jgi:putative lipoic acid-binding regulatory protein